MNSLDIARQAIAQEIKRLAADRARLTKVLESLDGEDAAAPSPAVAQPAAGKAKRRLRLKEDVAADLTSKIVKAVKAYREGASRKDILTYLSRNGYEVGHHFNEPHLSKLIQALTGGDEPQIRREGEKASTRYFAV